MHIPVGSIISNDGSWIRLLLLLLLPSDIPIHVMVLIGRRMLVVAMLVLRVIVVVKVIEGGRIFCEAGLLLLLLVGVLVSGEVLFGGNWGEGGVGCRREWGLGSGQM